MSKPVIYQLVVRYFGNTNTTNRPDGSIRVNGCGRFADVNEAALRALRGMGVTHVWLTGCLRQATLTDYSAIGLPPDDPDVVKGIAGSFYAVKDCFDVSPDYARDPASRLAEFDDLVARVHGAGMKALIDLVPNHVARGYRSVVNPELQFGDGDDVGRFFDPHNYFFYVVDPPGERLYLSKPAQWNPPGVQFDGAYLLEDGTPGRPPKATGNNCASARPSATDWYETVKLNYGYDFVSRTGHYSPRPRTWDAMNQVLAYWQRRGVDGFRCDFAHYVPAEAWAFLIGRARQRDPAVYFLAEAYPYEGSGDPVTEVRQLTEAGFDAVYHHESYNALKRIYQGTGGQDDYNQTTVSMSPEARRHALAYLENHDERRIASPVVRDRWTGDSGFGAAAAGYLLAPIHLLFGPGPVLLLNGQEVGEPGEGAPGFSGEDGRTTVFDYWAMPEFAKWVNRHAYDGGGLSPEQRRLRHFYAGLLAVCQDPAIRGDGYWGLKYFNRPDRFPDCPAALYSYARFVAHGGRLVLVVGNFDASESASGRIRLPRELAENAALPSRVAVRLRFTADGTIDRPATPSSRQTLIDEGLEVKLPPQTAYVYVIE
jgi:glycosidase